MKEGLRLLGEAVKIKMEEEGADVPGQVRGLCRMCIQLQQSGEVGNNLSEDDLVKVFDVLDRTITAGTVVKVWCPYGLPMVKVHTLNGDDWYPAINCTVL